LNGRFCLDATLARSERAATQVLRYDGQQQTVGALVEVDA
jgi:hypothetical protein